MKFTNTIPFFIDDDLSVTTRNTLNGILRLSIINYV